MNSQAQGTLFHETQRFRSTLWWPAMVVLLILFGLSALSAWAARIGADALWPFGEIPSLGLCVNLTILTVVFGLCALLFFVCELTVVVKPDRLRVRFFPFHLSFRVKRLEDIEGFRAEAFRPVRDYGGWGLRWGIKGKAYLVRGNRGVRLKFRNERPLMIGSQRPELFVEALEKAKTDAEPRSSAGKE